MASQDVSLSGKSHPFKEISIVVPSYNEEARLGESLEIMIDYLKKNFDRFEIIVVDDGSKDRTSDVGAHFSQVRILRNEPNRGKGYSVKRGILDSKYQIVLFSDSDLATPIEEVAKMIPFIQKGYTVVIASRNLKDSNIVVKQPLYRQFLGKTFPLLVNLIAVGGIKDTQCGFKLFRTDAAKRIVKYQTFERFSFDVEILFIARKMGYRIKEVAVTWIDKAGSKVSPIKDGISMGKDLLRLRWNQLLGKYRIKKSN